MGQRLDLHAILSQLAPNVYFQPPANVTMKYPCIVYSRDGEVVHYADNAKYKNKRRYQLTVIDRDPDSDILAKVEELPLCSYSRFFAADNLNHDVYNLFF